MTITRDISTPDYLVSHNCLDEVGFKHWLFYPGMLFGAEQLWWGTGARRPTPHEGVDFCLYQDTEARVHELSVTTRVPAVCEGTIVRIAPDFLGQSVYLKHSLLNDEGQQFYTIYGHTQPDAMLQLGKHLEAEETFACIAPVSTRSKVLPHLHLTCAWISTTYPPECLSWANLASAPEITLLDPLDSLGCPYGVDTDELNLF